MELIHSDGNKAFKLFPIWTIENLIYLFQEPKLNFCDIYKQKMPLLRGAFF
tara:strand:+ start:17075 stop:17227 length:153 start_codon:yes stop_codon:yes gene_type:complete